MHSHAFLNVVDIPISKVLLCSSYMLCCVTKGFKLNSDLEQKLCLVLAVLTSTDFDGPVNAVHQQRFRKG